MDKRRNHIIFWVGYLSWYGLLYLTINNEEIPFYGIPLTWFSANSLIFISFYYFSYFLIPSTLPVNKQFLFILGVIIYMLFLVVILYTIFLFFYEPFNKPLIKWYVHESIIITQESLCIAFPFWFLKNYISSITQKDITERRLRALKKIILNTELLGLKNQINPHFFYNILNFLYSQSLPITPKLSKAILTLSDMMRYAIRDNDELDKVPLEKEINYLENYIQLENLQRSKNSKIAINILGNVKYRRVTPLIFQSLLDNIVNYGKNITINLNIEENYLYFSGVYQKKENVDNKTIYESIEHLKQKSINIKDYVLSQNFNSENQIYNLCLHLKL
jgi:two-component system, LytTR family, sensor kinase